MEPTLADPSVAAGLAVPGAPEGGVRAVGGDQVVVRPELRDDAVLDHRHPVGVVGGEEPVRDRDHGATLEDHGQRPLEVPGRARVDEGGRLVEHQGVRVGEHQPGQRHLLGLGRR